MYHFLYIFTVLTLCTLPTFGATNSGSKNNEFSFSIKGKFTGDTNYSPGTGPRAKITSPSTCNFDLYKGQTSFNLTTEFDSSITCPAGTNSITLEFTPDNSTAGISPKHKIQNPTHTINLTKTKKNYKLPDIVLVQTNKTASATPKKSTASMADVCKNSAGRLDCANLTITCTNGFNDDWDEQKALGAMCPNEVKSEQARREKLKNDAESRFCKSGMKFEADCSANKVVFGCSEYSRRAPNEIERNLQNYCSTTKTNTVEIQDETTQKRAAKEANEEKLKQICEESGTKGTWNKTLNKCNCNEKNHIFDKETGCGETTTAFKNNKEHLDNLNAELENILQELADGQQK